MKKWNEIFLILIENHLPKYHGVRTSEINDEYFLGLKSIYLAPTEEKARTNLDAVSAKWSEKYPHSMNRWYDNWDAVCPQVAQTHEYSGCFASLRSVQGAALIAPLSGYPCGLAICERF